MIDIDYILWKPMSGTGFLHPEAHFKYKDTPKKIGGWKKIHQDNSNSNKTRAAVISQDKKIKECSQR